MQRTLCGFVLLLACSSAHAVLLSRAGGQAYYDTDTDLTWAADANLAQTSGHDADGAMDWLAAVGWIDSLNAEYDGLGYLGTNEWRLPTVEPLNGSTFDYSRSFNGSTDFGFNLSEQGTAYAGSTGSEMAYLFHNTLDNKSICDPLLSTAESCSEDQAGWGLNNTGPFSNIQFYYYWYGTEYAPETSSAWDFYFVSGEQDANLKSYAFYAWAVRPGDIGDVPFDDADSDGVADAIDNCTNIPNAIQCDSDGDGYGNHCDGDLNNNGFTNAFDTPLFRAQIGQAGSPPNYSAADFNCNGFVNAFDTPIFRSLLGKPPGPSGLVQ
jgi:hypothetical protein